MSKKQPDPNKPTKQEKKMVISSRSGPEGRRTVVYGKVIRNEPPKKNG